jgi:hypothetical protein
MSEITSLVEGQKLGDALVYIADKLGVTVQYVYEVFVKAQQTIAIINFIALVLFLVISVVGIRLLLKRYYGRTHNEYSTDWVVEILIPALIIIIVSMGALAIMADIAVQFTCPEYSAIKEMLHYLT